MVDVRQLSGRLPRYVARYTAGLGPEQVSLLGEHPFWRRTSAMRWLIECRRSLTKGEIELSATIEDRWRNANA